ncbi:MULTISPECIES: TIGR02281 family clan AA aspartic protease [unclassified Ensifer]|uniref:TIGR02281 family clan AA aspartic protease n=1 Tax=unclassified Ensifer TaxID=2633371 RepID=UPI000813840C|nr:MULTISPECIES: TIGR02281 family clan AA aspartic protease [unclassified Ensifer]OCP10224.1 aspartic protease [Ensifer sp. LC13]OCP11222.1 aspartic protease [Ensifer sp. LC11]OCP14705.1 aspartic protease [Ensifer sp. LC14]OCP33182.1 aspartic protease [Ensifer sp. LC499]
MTRLAILLSILAIGLILLIINHDAGRTMGLANDDFGQLVSLAAIATLLGAGILQSRRRFGEGLRQVAIWLLIVLALISAYVYRFELQGFGNRLLAGLVPGRATVITDSEGRKEVVLQKMLNGHFETTATVDGQEISMLVDTGASSIALTYEDAEKVGLDPANLDYILTVMTANGRAQAAPVMLQEISIGPITRRNIGATVAAKGKLDQSLLGMSFLATLDMLQMRTDELRLRD